MGLVAAADVKGWPAKHSGLARMVKVQDFWRMARLGYDRTTCPPLTRSSKIRHSNLIWLGLPERHGICRTSEGKNVLWMYGPAKVAQEDKMVETPSKSKAVSAIMDDQRLKKSCHGAN